MLGVERKQFIFDLIQERSSMTVSELSQLCSVGEETIRRDLNKMAAEGLIEKIYGGATIRQTMHRVIPLSMRKVFNVAQKKQIARCCATMIEVGDTIFLDGSSTAMEIAHELISIKNLVVITNAAEIACRLADNPGIKVIGIGGTMRELTRTFVGNSSVSAIRGYYADKAFICCDGVDMKTGITDAHEMEADVRKAMLGQSTLKVLASDHTKFDKTSFASITDFSGIDVVVTDRTLSSQWVSLLETHDVSCHFCDIDPEN